MFNFYNYLRKKFSEYSAASGQKGTVIDELSIKPTGLIMADFHNALVNQRRVNDISNWESMTEDELNFYGNKFFLPRIEGSLAYTTARIWFDEKKNIELSSTSEFVSTNGYRFIVAQPGIVSKSSFNVSDDRYANYYIDIPIVSKAKGSAYRIPAGDITRIDGINFSYKMVSNPEAATGGVNHENNEQYYKRLSYSINDRSLLSKRSVFARLPSLFPSINAMYASGANDKYMRRDYVAGVDLSARQSKSDFLGRTQGESIVKSIGFFGNFPPTPSESQKSFWGPFSVRTEYDYPLSIEAIDLSGSISREGQTGDPALHGFPLDQEMSDDMYRGLYFDDYRTFLESGTSDLLNIRNEDVGFTKVIAPSDSWVYGAHGAAKRNLGSLYDDVKDIDVLGFLNNQIIMAGGSVSSISVGKDISKRTGVKITGSLRFPEVVRIEDEPQAPARSNLQIMAGGLNLPNIDGYTGIGFGIRLTDTYFSPAEDPSLPNNAIVYLAHSEKYDTAQVFINEADYSTHTGITGSGALSEQFWRIEPGIDYDFEFIIHDDLRLTLYLEKTENKILDGTEKEDYLHFQVPKNSLNVFSQEIFNKNSSHYGTMLKVTLDSTSESVDDQWIISDLKAFDTQQSRATIMMSLDVSKMESPVSIYLRAFGYGALNGSYTEGYKALIWDKEVESFSDSGEELVQGGWSMLDGVSNPNGSKDVVSSLLRHRINNLDRYKVNSRFGETIFIMIAASGTSLSNSRYANSIQDDVHSTVRADYIKVESETSIFYHANNKADLYVSTVKNSEQLEIATTSVTKNPTDGYFTLSESSGFKMPIQDIISVTLGANVDTENALSDTDYRVVRPDVNLIGSSKEEINIILDGLDSDTITVEYTTYPAVADIQNFYDGREYGKMFGDILVRHKFPVYLRFTLNYTGLTNDTQVVDEIRKYVDSNPDSIFSVRSLIEYLYENEFVNSVQEPIVVSYELSDDEGRTVTGTFTDRLTVRDIDYFRIDELSANKL